MELPFLFEEDGALTFAAAEVTTTGDAIRVMGAAQTVDEPVGLVFEISMLTGSRGVHPADLVSIGHPTQQLIAALSHWGPVPDAVLPVGAFRLDGHVTSTWREIATKTPIPHFKPPDLRWEKARFRFQGLNRDVNTWLNLEVELDLDNRRFTLRVPAEERPNFATAFTGV